MNRYDLPLLFKKINSFCAVNNISVQSVYDTCHGMTLQELVYYLLGVIRNTLETLKDIPQDFEDLKIFVENYFRNLDVQEEINNKINDMIQDGSFATLLVNVTALANVKNYGAIGDGVTDDTQAFKSAIADNKYSGILIPQGNFKITETLYITRDIVVEGEKDSTILFYPNDDNYDCFVFSGSIGDTHNVVSSDTETGTLTLETNNDFKVGDIVLINSNEKLSPSAREYDTKQQITKITKVQNNALTVADNVLFDYTQANSSTIQKINTIKVNVSGVNIECKNYISYSRGIHLNYCESVNITKCYGDSFDYSVITLEHCYNFNIGECSGFNIVDSNLQYLITVEYSDNGSVIGCYGNSARTAIDVSKMSNNITISSNSVSGNINTHACTSVIISNNTVSNGIIMIRGTNIIVSNNIVKCYNQSCLLFDEAAIYLGNISIANNKFYGMIDTYIPKKISINNNTFDCTSGKGLKCKTTSTDNTLILNNSFHGFNTCIDFSECASINNTIISGNTFLQVTTALQLTSLASSGNNCQINNNSFYATNPIIIRGISYVAIKDNFFSNTAANAIKWSSGAIDVNNIYLVNNINASTTYFFVQEANNQTLSNVFEYGNISSSSLTRLLKATFIGVRHTIYSDTTDGNVYELYLKNGAVTATTFNSIGV